MTKDWQDIPLQDWHDAYLKLLKENINYDEALDEACAYIAGCYHDYEDERVYWSPDQWKEYLLAITSKSHSK